MKINKSLMFVKGISLAAVIAANPVFANTSYKVKASDNLSRIVKQHYPKSTLSRSQILVGILASNPAAFKGGNINYLMTGKHLSLPDEANLKTISKANANKLLAKHTRYFKKGKTGNLKPPLSAGIVNNDAQNEKAQKVKQLEAESEALRTRIKELVAAKADKDVKLDELDSALEKTHTK